MKKLIPLLLIALMVVILGSCVGNKEPIVLQDSEDTSQIGDQSPNEVSTDDSTNEPIINESDPIDDDICSPIQDVISAVPDGYISNSFATKIGHMREDGSVGFTDAAGNSQLYIADRMEIQWNEHC